jgi:hypothetical protein
MSELIPMTELTDNELDAVCGGFFDFWKCRQSGEQRHSLERECSRRRRPHPAGYRSGKRRPYRQSSLAGVGRSANSEDLRLPPFAWVRRAVIAIAARLCFVIPAILNPGSSSK